MPCMISRRFSTHFLLELEGRDAERQQAADARRDDRTRSASRRCAPGCPRIPGPRARRRRWRRACRSTCTLDMSGFQPALERLIGDVLLDRADGDRAQPVVERAGALAQAVLRTDAAAHLGQRVGLVRQLRRLEQVAFLDQLQPVGDVVVDRALPLAEGIAAGEAAPRLLRRPPAGVVAARRSRGSSRTRTSTGDLAGSVRGMSRNCRFLSAMWQLASQAARRRFSISESIEAALGFTTQNLPM